MSSLNQGIVVAARGRRFVVRAKDGSDINCVVRQKVKNATKRCTPVAVGDDVDFSLSEKNSGCIEKVQPRRTSFFRPAKGSDQDKQVIAANLDLLAIVVAVASPPLKTGLIDRFLIAAHEGELSPLIVLNKSDLPGPPDLDIEEIIRTYESIDVPVFKVSALSGSGLDSLESYLCSHRTLFAGHSGVGKSTLLNKLIPGLDLRTREISEFSDRGKHTTSNVQLYELPSGGMVIDSPGLKIMGLWNVERDNLKHYYTEFEKFVADCRFSGCSHTHEPDCGVKSAVEKGEISSFRYRNFLTISESL